MAGHSTRAIRLGQIAFDVLVFFLAYFFAYMIRFEGSIPQKHLVQLQQTFPLAIALRLAAFYYMGLYRSIHRHPSAQDVWQIVKASGISSAVFIFLLFLLEFRTLSRSVFIIDFLLVVLMASGSRLLVSFISDRRRRPRGPRSRVLVIGAGGAGEMVIREMEKNRALGYVPVGVVDDDPGKRGLKVRGVPVLGTCEDLPRFVADREVHEVIIAVPSCSPEQMKRIVDHCRRAGRPFRTVPGLKELMDGRITVDRLREVNIEDLLCRKVVRLDGAEVANYMRGKRVLVTGAGGSIGSELCRQIARHRPEQLLAVDQAENGLFALLIDLANAPTEVCPVVLDVTDYPRVEKVLKTYRPQVVFHAAAHKHVPLMELNPEESIRNNVFGTASIARACECCGVEQFILISTDKAVNPHSVMGVSKRIAELYVSSMAREDRGRFCTIRFGNVLDSEGSVVPLFRRQIEAGGPVTVTHPEVTRFFMTIPEAVQLVSQASVMSEGGEVFILDMGRPVEIAALARELIRLAGLEPGSDIDIAFTCLRPGEKLREELWEEGELPQRTKHEQILVARPQASVPELSVMEEHLRQLASVLASGDRESLVTKLVELVPSYVPSEDILGACQRRSGTAERG